MVSLLSGVQFLKEFGIFTFIMPFLLFFLVTNGILSYIKPFGDDKVVNSILAFIVAFMAIQFLPILIFIQLMVPYLLAVFLIIFLVWVLLKFMGVKEEALENLISHPGFYGVIILVIIVGVFVFMSASFPELDKTKNVTDPLGGVYVGGQELSESGGQIIVTETDEGTATVITPEKEDPNEGYLQNTIFHPTILSLVVMFVVFGTAAYMVTVLKEA